MGTVPRFPWSLGLAPFSPYLQLVSCARVPGRHPEHGTDSHLAHTTPERVSISTARPVPGEPGRRVHE